MAKINQEGTWRDKLGKTLLTILSSMVVFSFLVSCFTVLEPFILRNKPLEQHGDIFINHEGLATQNDKTVGYFLRKNDDSLMTLVLASESGIVLTDTSLTIHLPEPISWENIDGTITSLQGTEGMTIIYEGPTRLQLEIATLLPESYAQLALTIPSSYFKLSPLMLFFSWLHALPTYLWLMLAGLTTLCSIFCRQLFTGGSTIHTTEERTTPPDNLNPAELAILLRSYLQASDVSALIYSLAHRGHLSMIKGQETYFLRRGKDEELLDYEQELLKLISPEGTKPSSLQAVLNFLEKDIFSQAIGNIYIRIYRTLTERNLFLENPRDIHLRFKTWGIILQLLGLLTVTINFLTVNFTVPGLIIVGLAGYYVGRYIYSFGYKIVRLTPEGIELATQAAAFSNYLSNKEQIGHEGDQGNLFYDYLPFALVLGKELPWFERFRRVTFSIPDWFSYTNEDIVDPLKFFKSVEETTSLIGNVFVRLKDPNVD